MTDDELKQQFVVLWVERVSADTSCTPLAPEEVCAILEATDLELKVPTTEVAQHLGAIKWFLLQLKSSRTRRDEWKAEQQAVAEVRNLLRDLGRKLTALFNPDTPLSRATRSGAYLLALKEGRLPPFNFSEPATLQTSRDYAQALLAIGEAYEAQTKHKDRFWDMQQREAEQLLGAMRRLLDSLKYYDKNTVPPPTSGGSRAQWNRHFVGEFLPALYQRYFDREFGISTNPGKGKKRGGPGLRFLRSAAEALGVVKDNGKPYSDEGLHKLWVTAKDEPWIRAPVEEEPKA
jgi:hypothetical protein